MPVNISLPADVDLVFEGRFESQSPRLPFNVGLRSFNANTCLQHFAKQCSLTLASLASPQAYDAPGVLC
jgi:hypothetical protein